MLCISRSANLTMPVRDRKVIYNPATGAVMDVKRALSVQFQRSPNVPDYAREAVQKMPDWGRGCGIDEDPFERCGIFDSFLAAEQEGWTDEERVEVEDALRRVAGHSFVVADKPKTAKPWPNYDAVVGTDEKIAVAISKKVQEDGYDPAAVKAYEVENANRSVVLEALDYLIAESESDVLGVISA